MRFSSQYATRICALSLVLTLGVGSFPLQVFAEKEDTSVLQPVETTLATDGSSEGLATSVTSTESDTIDKTDAAPAAAPLATSVSTAPEMRSGTIITPHLSVEAQVNTTKVRVRVDNVEELIQTNTADTLRLHAEMLYKDKVVRQVSQELPLTPELAQGVAVDLKDFGKFELHASFVKGGVPVHQQDQTIGVVADSYVIAPVSASLPTAFFSLNLWGGQSVRSQGPVIALLERPSAWNWDALPQPEGDTYGVYGLPYLSHSEIRLQPGTVQEASDLFRSRADMVADYVGELLSLKPDSKINLWCVDYYSGLIQRIIYANRVPAQNYTITLLSDGSWSYAMFEYKYQGDNPQGMHEVLKKNWADAKAYAYTHGKVEESYRDWVAAHQSFWALVDLEPNAQWWITRKALVKSPNDGNAFGSATIQNNKIVQVNIANLLKNNIATSDKNIREFKALYNFNDDYFAKAQASGKDVMLFLGGQVQNEIAFLDYARLTMSYYGDAYSYYYKGHPGTPTALSPVKQAQLKELSVEDVESSIAAELILFFNPSIYLSGYTSSTYASVPDGMAKGMFEMRKSYGISQPQFRNMDFWASRMDTITEPELKALSVSGHICYLVEFSDAIIAREGYEVAVWDASASRMLFYKKQNGAYVLIKDDSGISQKSTLPAGEYIIKPQVGGTGVLDVTFGHTGDGGNVALYEHNNTPAQRWQISYDAEGLATIKAVHSGKVLDVTWGSTTPGTNIQQWTSNDTLAQKWQILSNGDGTYRIVSALDPSKVLDIYCGWSGNYTNVQLWENNNTNAQRFLFLSTEGVTDPGTTSLDATDYQLVPASDTSQTLEIPYWGWQPQAQFMLNAHIAATTQTFTFTKLDNGFYHIVNTYNGLALDMPEGAFLPGSRVYQNTADPSKRSQQWKLTSDTQGVLRLQNAYTSLFLDLNPSRTGVVASQIHAGESQRWHLLKVATPLPQNLGELAQAEQGKIKPGIYELVSEINQGKSLDVWAASHANMAQIQLWDRNNTYAQRWNITIDDAGFATFTSLVSGKALDVAWGQIYAGAPVWQYESNGSKAQKWVPVVVGQQNNEVTVTLVSALHQGLALDVWAGQDANGTAVQLWWRNGSAAQRFKLIPR